LIGKTERLNKEPHPRVLRLTWCGLKCYPQPSMGLGSTPQFDVIVIGGGHAGTEAAHASARMGRKTALLSLNVERIGFMSCNPAMGGLAKGQLIKEIDALGGIMGINTDKTAIQYRRLNSSKGPAVRSSRAQCDKALYAKEMQ